MMSNFDFTSIGHILRKTNAFSDDCDNNNLDDPRSVRRVPGPPLHIRDDRPHRDQEEAAARRSAAGAVPQPAPALGAGLQVLQDTR